MNYNIIHSSDSGFPNIPSPVKEQEKPTVFAYRGDIGLLSQIENNIAVIGVLTPDENIIEREKAIIAEFAKKGRTIVSGLAQGCDTAAHEAALRFGVKTVAFLPSTLDNIYPKENKALADKIVENGGLIITEYLAEPKDRYERIKRFIERDRLQAMFASAVILIASYRKGEGDSGSRHCMQKAVGYGVQRYIMYNPETDVEKAIFGLNADLYGKGVPVLTQGKIDAL